MSFWHQHPEQMLIPEGKRLLPHNPQLGFPRGGTSLPTGGPVAQYWNMGVLKGFKKFVRDELQSEDPPEEGVVLKDADGAPKPPEPESVAALAEINVEEKADDIAPKTPAKADPIPFPKTQRAAPHPLPHNPLLPLSPFVPPPPASAFLPPTGVVGPVTRSKFVIPGPQLSLETH